MARHPFDVTTPPQLPEYLSQLLSGPECDMPSDVRSFFHIHHRAVDGPQNTRPKATFEVYKFFEFGLLPVLPDRSEAIAWCKYASSIAKPEPMTSAAILKLRRRHHLSQPVFASFLNVSASTVEKWESGDKKPSGAATRLLSIVEKHGIDLIKA